MKLCTIGFTKTSAERVFTFERVGPAPSIACGIPDERLRAAPAGRRSSSATRPLTRFPGFVWLIAAGFKLSKEAQLAAPQAAAAM